MQDNPFRLDAPRCPVKKTTNFSGAAVPAELTKETIERAFDAMGQMAAERGLVIDIAVYGGSCLVLASDIRNASVDVDAVFLTERSAVRDIADAVARNMRLPIDWINEAVRQVAPPRGNPEPNLLPFGDYPRGDKTAVGLRVHLPAPAYLLAMKVLANRAADDWAKAQSDEDDAVALMKITGIITREALVGLLQECYPRVPQIVEPALSPRLSAKIDSLLDAYARSSNHPDPTWHAGRGRATRPR
jgi:hypothetical protein